MPRMTPLGAISRPTGGGPGSFGMEPHDAPMPAIASGRNERVSRMPVPLEPVGQKAHEAAVDDLSERMLAVPIVEQVESDAAHLGLIVEKSIADARVEQRVRVEVKGLVDDLLLLDVADLLGPVLGRYVVNVDLRVDPDL